MNFELLKHKDLCVDFDFIANLIWYSVAKDSYLQRKASLDNTWIADEISNPFVSFLCRKILSLDKLTIYENVSSCDSCVRNNECLPDNSIGIYLSSKSLFFDLCHKIRNSVAHGIFNIIGDEFLGIGQIKAKLDSPINLRYKIKLPNKKVFCELFESVFELGSMDSNDLKTFALKHMSAFDAGDDKFLIDGKTYCFENRDFIPSKANIEKINSEGLKNQTHVFNKIKRIPTLNEQVEELKNEGVLLSIEDFFNRF